MRIAQLVLITLTFAFAAGCPKSGSTKATSSAQAPATPTAPPEAPRAEPVPPAAATTDPYSFHSSAGTYLIHLRPVPEQFPTNQMLTLTAAVVDSSTGEPLEGELELAFDAAMPGHGHGMNTMPKVTPLQGKRGEFTITGVNLHMSGDWELYFDVTYKGVTERAQVNVTLE